MGVLVKKKKEEKKTWAHINEFTARAAQSSSRGMTSRLGNVCASACKREHGKDSIVGPTSRFRCEVAGARARNKLLLMTKVCVAEKMFSLEEPITQQPAHTRRKKEKKRK